MVIKMFIYLFLELAYKPQVLNKVLGHGEQDTHRPYLHGIYNLLSSVFKQYQILLGGEEENYFEI